MMPREKPKAYLSVGPFLLLPLMRAVTESNRRGDLSLTPLTPIPEVGLIECRPKIGPSRFNNACLHTRTYTVGMPNSRYFPG